MTAIRFYLMLGLLGLVTVLVYGPGLAGGFVFDDFPNVVHNDALALGHFSAAELLRAAFSSDSGPFSRPLSMLSFAVERHFYGLDPWPMKLTNVLIHVINVALVATLLQALLTRMQRRDAGVRQWMVSARTLALVVTVAWALAPINLTAVLYVVQRMESLAALCMLAGLLAYVHGRNRIETGDCVRGWLWVWGGVAGGTLLGVLAKETAVMLPVHALLIEWLVFRFGADDRLVRRQLIKFYSVVLLLPATLGLAWYLPRILSGAAYAGRPFDLAERLWTQAHVLWHYLGWIALPRSNTLGFYHDAFPVAHGLLEPWTTLPAVFGLVVLIVGAVLIRRRAPAVTFGVLWFFVMHLLVSSVLPLEMVFEHRNYLPSIGVFLAVFAAILHGDVRVVSMLARKAVIAGLIVLYGLLCLMRADEWSDPLRQAYFETVQQPQSPRAQHELGMVLSVLSPGADSLQFSEALARFELAASLPGATLTPMQALVFERSKHGLPVASQWWQRMRAYVRDNPLRAQDLSALSGLLAAQINGVIRVDAAELGALLRETRDHHPHNAQVVAMYGRYLYAVAGKKEEAGVLLQRATALAPRSAIRWDELTQYQIATGRYEQARSSLSRLRELNRFSSQDAALARLQTQLMQAMTAAERS